MEWFEDDRSRESRVAARRRHQREVTYRRRRLGAVAIFVVVVIAFVLLASGDLTGGGGGGPFATPEETAKPVNFTVEASGGILIHSPLWARALQLGGGSKYDFAPLFAQLTPYLRK